MASQQNGFWPDSQLPSTSDSEPSNGFTSSFDSVSTAFINSPFPAPDSTVNSQMFAHPSGPMMSSTFDSGMADGAFSAALGAEGLQGTMAMLQRRLMGDSSKPMSPSAGMPFLPPHMVGQSSAGMIHNPGMASPNPNALPMAWALSHSGSTNLPFSPASVTSDMTASMSHFPMHASGMMPTPNMSASSPGPMNGNAGSALSFNPNVAAGPSTTGALGMQGTSMPSSPAVLGGLGNGHGNSPATNEASGSESAQSAIRSDRPRGSNVGGSTAGTTRRTKFRRSRTGCMVCRKRKVKCDQDGLPCKQCRIGKRDCHYEESLPKRKRKSTGNGNPRSASTVSPSNVGQTGNAGEGVDAAHKSMTPSQSSLDSGHIPSSQPADITLTAPTQDSQHFFSQQAIFDKLTHAGTAGALMADALTSRGALSGGEDDSKEPSEHWASTASNFTMLNGHDDWNITTPSTGATSVHTVDGELVNSNNSSRRMTMTDDRLDGYHADGKDVFDPFSGLTSSVAGVTDGNEMMESKLSWSPIQMDASQNNTSTGYEAASLIAGHQT